MFSVLLSCKESCTSLEVGFGVIWKDTTPFKSSIPEAGTSKLKLSLQPEASVTVKV